MRKLVKEVSTSFRLDGEFVSGDGFEPVAMFPSLENVRVRIESTGTTVIESTMSPLKDVEEDTAKWDQEASVSATSKTDIAVPITAIRLTGSDATFIILAT